MAASVPCAVAPLPLRTDGAVLTLRPLVACVWELAVLLNERAASIAASIAALLAGGGGGRGGAGACPRGRMARGLGRCA